MEWNGIECLNTLATLRDKLSVCTYNKGKVNIFKYIAMLLNTQSTQCNIEDHVVKLVHAGCNIIWLTVVTVQHNAICFVSFPHRAIM